MLSDTLQIMHKGYIINVTKDPMVSDCQIGLSTGTRVPDHSEIPGY